MYRFYVNQNQIEDKTIKITGLDVNHIKNVLRMEPGQKIIICNGQGKDFYCIIDSILREEVNTVIEAEVKTAAELETRIYLFQGLPKKDKMELIIQKAVELGVYQVIPVMMERTVVQIHDKKKEEKKLERFRMIAESAAKQSGRGIIPIVTEFFPFKGAVEFCKTLGYGLIPYENAKNMEQTRKSIKDIKGRPSAGFFIGPEGGITEQELVYAQKAGILPITLGHRILRTETAGLALLSMMMYELEG